MSNDQPAGSQPEQPDTPATPSSTPARDPYAQPPGAQPPGGGQVPPSYDQPSAYEQQQPPSYGEATYGQPQEFDPASAGYGQPAEPPKSILNAVKLMYVGAALSALGLIISFATLGSVRDTLREDNPDFTQSQIDTGYTIFIGTAVVIGVISIGLWIWMAASNKKGKSWARTVATVLGGLNIVFTLIGFSGGGGGASMVSNIISIVLAAAILYLLYRPESSEYYAARSRKL